MFEMSHWPDLGVHLVGRDEILGLTRDLGEGCWLASLYPMKQLKNSSLLFGWLLNTESSKLFSHVMSLL
jgi:hypothetical protein